MPKKYIQKKSREYINKLCVTYQPRWKRWAVLTYKPFYQIIAVFDRRQQAQHYAMTNLDFCINEKIKNRCTEQLKNNPQIFNQLAQNAVQEKIIENFSKRRLKQVRPKPIKKIEKELKQQTAENNYI